jgi:DNA mismatch repair protein MutS2
MSVLYEKSMEKLELNAVLSLLADQASSEETKRQCRAMKPLSDVDDIIRLQAQTGAACTLITRKGSPGLSGIQDVGESLARADRGGTLSAGELLRVAGVLRCARTVKNYAETDAVSTVLDPYFWELMGNKFLEDKIETAIISEEEIADAASPELADIRRHIRIQSAKVRESLQKIISSPTYSKYLQEPIITIRSDRFVVPVKSEHKGSIPGLIHDVSSSGSTFFIEPMQAVNANNAIRELFLAERKEIERILAELSADAAAYREHIDHNYEILVLLDGIFARAKLSFVMKAVQPEIRTDGRIHLKRARHPLIDKNKVVPISVRLGDDYDTMVITGPNTGGKTVTLKTLGLLTLMAECGLHIPADDGSCISVYDRVLADIGDEQSIEQSLSTFSSHMRNIVRMIEQCDNSTLVLFDELGAGTDPAEGAALAISLIQFCRQCGAKVAATTHYAELKLFAMRTPGVINASCEFDVETLQPTYRLLIGIPGKSNAFAISRKLGLPEHIIADASNLVNENDASFEDVLNQLEQQRQAMETARQEAERLRLEIERTKKQSDAYYAEITKEKEKALQKAKDEARRIIDDARRTANQVADEMKQLRKQMRDAADAQGVNVKQTELRRALNEAEERLAGEKQQPKRPTPTRAIRAGDTVELIKLGSKATVISVNKDGTYQLQAGIMKITAKPDEVYLLEEQKPASVRKILDTSKREPRMQAAQPELDIRGMASDEMLGVLGVFLDNAYLANLHSVRIIHGKGTGVLRAAVHAELRKCKYVKKFRLGTFGEGEDGVTVAEFS